VADGSVTTTKKSIAERCKGPGNIERRYSMDKIDVDGTLEEFRSFLEANENPADLYEKKRLLDKTDEDRLQYMRSYLRVAMLAEIIDADELAALMILSGVNSATVSLWKAAPYPERFMLATLAAYIKHQKLEQCLALIALRIAEGELDAEWTGEQINMEIRRDV
jgi:hypothetical protein